MSGYSRAPRWDTVWDTNDWLRMLSEAGVPHLRAAQWAADFASDVQPGRFSAGVRDVRDWLPQVLHETGMLGALKENLNYSAARIVQVWPRRFATERDAAPFANNPSALAEKVYGGRMGNTMPGDGAKFIGRGLIMVTGRAGYRSAGDLAGQDYENMPDLLEYRHYAIECAIAWWEGHIPDSALSDQVQLRRRVNGGEVGLEHCQQLADVCRRVLA